MQQGVESSVDTLANISEPPVSDYGQNDPDEQLSISFLRFQIQLSIYRH